MIQRKKIFIGMATCMLAWGAAAWVLDDWGHHTVPIEDADCIVVLGARVVPPGVAGLSLRTRAGKAAELYAAGAARHIVCTGGVGHTAPAESIAAGEVLRERGVPPSAIEREERSTSTWENATETAAICQARGWTRVIVVSDAYHVWRATRNFRALGLQASAAAAPDPPLGRHIWMALREVVLVVRDAMGRRL